MPIQPAPRNRTITLTDEERARYLKTLLPAGEPVAEPEEGLLILGQMQEAVRVLPRQCADLLFLDPPYNLTRKFGAREFYKIPPEEYRSIFEEWLLLLLPLLKPHATVYVCADWYTSSSIFPVLERHLKIRNRITWEREKGRGAKRNWKNSCEDIWFCTCSEEYIFNLDAVKIRRSVIAPYRNEAGAPKDWQQSEQGRYRLTHPSNFWTDITVPFWSMPENTSHPTQKPEKLLAKLILASTDPGGLVLDPFCGSGTACVTAKKLGRRYFGIEREEEYAALAAKRLELAAENPAIQGYEDGIFWERNAKRGGK